MVVRSKLSTPIPFSQSSHSRNLLYPLRSTRKCFNLRRRTPVTLHECLGARLHHLSVWWAPPLSTVPALDALAVMQNVMTSEARTAGHGAEMLEWGGVAGVLG